MACGSDQDRLISRRLSFFSPKRGFVSERSTGRMTEFSTVPMYLILALYLSGDGLASCQGSMTGLPTFQMANEVESRDLNDQKKGTIEKT